MKLGMRILSKCLCFYGCPRQNMASRVGTRIWNLTERPIDLQIRVGSILKKAHTVKPGSSKRLKCKTIYKAYMPGSSGKSSTAICYDEMCLPYVWIYDSATDLPRSRVVKQQYVSLEDLRDSSEIRIYRDHHRGCILVQKKQRTDFC